MLLGSWVGVWCLQVFGLLVKLPRLLEFCSLRFSGCVFVDWICRWVAFG